MGGGGGPDVILKSSRLRDDDFARDMLKVTLANLNESLPRKVPAPENRFGFSNVLYLTPDYHGELAGRLDDKRASTLLCVPIFESEFSGAESPAEFKAIRRSTPINDWSRSLQPRIKLRFENSKTGAGTGDGYVFCALDLVLNEIGNLVGDPDGFLEIINFKERVMEILYSPEQGLGVIFDRNDEHVIIVDVGSVEPILWEFLIH